jgi:hypothetical protein
MKWLSCHFRPASMPSVKAAAGESRHLSASALNVLETAPLNRNANGGSRLEKWGIWSAEFEGLMKPLFESRYLYPQNNGKGLYKAAGGSQLIPLRSTVPERWLSPNFALIGAVARTGNGLVDLWEASPVRLDSNEPNADEIIDLLFPGNPLLCCGWTRYRFETRVRTHWHKLHDLQFIVPNPMAALRGVTQRGKFSAHALSNTGRRRFLIVEFDLDASNSAEEARLLERLATEGRDVRDLCAALLLHLAEKAPLTLAVHSGGKSLHGWFHCAGVPEEKVWGVFNYAVSLGADRASWTPSQFARMPDGLRENGRRQTVYFLNPEVLR